MDVVLNGSGVRLEGHVHSAVDASAPAVLLLHPNPLEGASMHSKTVHALYRAFVHQSFSCLRINFRGVGRSSGEHENGEGELADAASAMDWLQTKFDHAEDYWIGGVSFGAWIALQLLMRRPELTNFVVAAVPFDLYDFSFLAPCPVSGLLLHGAKDELVPADKAQTLQRTLARNGSAGIDLKFFEGAGHLMLECLPLLEDSVATHIIRKRAMLAKASRAQDNPALVP